MPSVLIPTVDPDYCFGKDTIKLLWMYFNHKKEIIGFDNTAALINNLDLVITVDTSIAHLAGALGKKVWIMLPFIPDFRWLLKIDWSPWYPSARLLRQTKFNDWDEIITLIQKDLKKV